VRIGHVSYLGDATIDEGVNIGAGTITANYDGQQKHETHIGKGAFIGSDTVLIAPVKVGPGGITGAGSVVTKGHDVPPKGIVAGVPARPLDHRAGLKAELAAKDGARAAQAPRTNGQIKKQPARARVTVSGKRPAARRLPARTKKAAARVRKPGKKVVRVRKLAAALKRPSARNRPARKRLARARR
jgi:carbonic anhydrase/acetyltransferase-like protein (isoleucine patch superfamily)